MVETDLVEAVVDTVVEIEIETVLVMEAVMVVEIATETEVVEEREIAQVVETETDLVEAVMVVHQDDLDEETKQ